MPHKLKNRMIDLAVISVLAIGIALVAGGLVAYWHWIAPDRCVIEVCVHTAVGG